VAPYPLPHTPTPNPLRGLNVGWEEGRDPLVPGPSPTTLSRGAAMGKVALVVTDMVKDFIDPRGALYVGEVGRAIIPFVAGRVEETRAGGGVVIFVCDAHAPDDREFEQFKPHALKNTWGSEVIPEIPYLAGDYRVDKTRYSALHDTSLEDILIREEVPQVELVGVCTSICIMFTAVSLLDRAFHCRVYRDGVADFDPQAHAFALAHLQKLGVEVV
jgi:nicotinamidase/pyrazinamidase